MLQAILYEIQLKKSYLPDQVIETIYFGGGTPSILSSQEIEKILNEIYRNYTVTHNPEITLEANPDDLDYEKIKDLKSTGINRLSIGIQSFFDDDLAYLGRIHNAQQAELVVKSALAVGFTNLTIDLIYGIPGHGNKGNWLSNLTKMNDLGVPHFSAYAITVESKTVLSHLIKKGKTLPVEDELISDQFFQLIEFAQKNHFEHYEISNFAQQGFISKHNSAYWGKKPYIGVGPSAHSYDIDSRQWNISINSEYISKVMSGEKYFDKETLGQKDKINEYLMLSLRTNHGTDLKKLNEMMAEIEFRLLLKQINEYIACGYMAKTGNKVMLTNQGIIFSDRIISGLFVD